METYYLRLTVQAFLFPNNHSLKIREDSHWLCLRNCPIWANPYGQLGHMPTLQRVGKRVGIIIDNSIRSDRVRELELPPPPKESNREDREMGKTTGRTLSLPSSFQTGRMLQGNMRAKHLRAKGRAQARM